MNNNTDPQQQQQQTEDRPPIVFTQRDKDIATGDDSKYIYDSDGNRCGDLSVPTDLK